MDKVFNFSVKEVFELPPGLDDTYLFTDVRSKAEGKKRTATEGSSFMLILEPYEVRIFDAVSEK